MIGGFRYLAKSAPIRVEKVTGPEAVQRLRQAADRMEPRIRQAFEQALSDLRERLSDAELAQLIEAGNINQIVNGLLGEAVTDNALLPFAAAIGAAAIEGGRVAAAVQPPVVGRNGQDVQFVFNATNPRVASFAQAQTSQRIREISEDVRTVVRDVITQETRRGANPLETARRVRQSIGLTQRQEAAVANFRRMLEEGRIDVLDRQLRDRRFDPSIRRAIEQGRQIPQAKIDRMVERYRDRYVKYRSEVIARTEALRAVHGAQNELFQSYIDEDRISEQQVRRFWHYTQDEKTRAEHRQIPSMNPNGAGMNEKFETPLGPLRFPGDPRGLAENVIQCRCVVLTRVVSMELLEDNAA